MKTRNFDVLSAACAELNSFLDNSPWRVYYSDSGAVALYAMHRDGRCTQDRYHDDVLALVCLVLYDIARIESGEYVKD